MLYNEVDTCPHNETEFTTAATRLNCEVDRNGFNQYTCVPKFNKTALVEFCYNFTVGYYPKDHCLRVVDDGSLNSYSCSQFTEGCPADDYRGSDLYQFPACSQLNTKERCFYAEPSCPNETLRSTTEDPRGSSTSGVVTNYGISNTTAKGVHTTLPTNDISKGATIGAIVGGVLSIPLIVFGILMGIYCWKRRKKQTRRKKRTRKDKSDEEANEVLLSTSHSNDIDNNRSENRSLRNTDVWTESCDENTFIAHRIEETVRIEARDLLKKTLTDTLTGSIISILNDMKNIINEATKDSEIEELYELIEEIIRDNRDERSILSSPFFIKLEQKIKSYADLRENKMQILARHARFILRLKKIYGARLESSQGSVLLTLTFSSQRGHDLYMQDKERGEIGKIILDVLLYPPYLANFDLRAEDLMIYLNDNELTAEINDVSEVTKQLENDNIGQDRNVVIMAESKISTNNSTDEEDNSIESPGDERQGPVKKRRGLTADKDSCTEQGVSPHESSDQTETIDQARKCSDPLTDLTMDQRVVLYTLFLYIGDGFGLDLDDDATMGDINVRRTLSELEERGLVGRAGDSVCISREPETVRSYMENCLLSDIDRDFYLQVASDPSLRLRLSTDTEQSGDVPITLMRLLMEGRGQFVTGNSEYYHAGFTDKEFQKFIQEWCRLRNIDIRTWADEISYEEAVRFLSAYTILERFETGFTELELDHKKWSILISILMSKNYTISVNALWEEKRGKINRTFPSLRESSHDMCTTEVMELVNDLVYNDNLLTVNGDVSSGTVGFVSDDVRHQVMGHFVLNCLKTDEDYTNYFNLSSADSLLEYVRIWWYDPDKKERCLYLPEKMEELFIRVLRIDVIRHVMVEKRQDRKTGFNDGDYWFRYKTRRDTVSKILKVPREILEWDYAARSRYAACVKKGTQTIHRARAMIVGCAGAGKSTLLKRLQKRSLDELKKVQSTVGLEVHEDIFEINPESDCLKDVPVDTDKEGKQLLSILDFAGQCAYYACHQVYLSRRAFYLLVIDMSKAFDEKIDPSICEQEGTMFTDWSYGEYMLFWLKSVHTYCDDDAPVIIVGTHLDQKKGQDSNMLYNSILDYLKYDKHLKTHLDRKRCFVLGFRSDGSFFEDTLSELDKCIVSIAKEERWKETIPTDWALSEVVLRELRGKKRRMTSVAEFSKNCFGENKEKYSQMKDILKFYHDIGVLLHFEESSLAETIIIDIQWFVDSFKNIITDPNHVRDIVDNNRDWLSFYNSGHILDSLLTKFWNRQHFEIDTSDDEMEPWDDEMEPSDDEIELSDDEMEPWDDEMEPSDDEMEPSDDEIELSDDEMEPWDQEMYFLDHKFNPRKRNQNKSNLLQYMERLGLIALGTDTHYIPCMNKRTFGIEEQNSFQSNQSKTSVLVLRFQFLPYFFYFRLIVACMTKTNGEWIVLKDNGLCLYKNVACFVYKRHAVALAVNRYSIQLQVFQPSQVPIVKDVTLEIRDNIERLLNDLTSNFHKKVMYTVGYQCSKQEVYREHDDCFIEEKEIYGKGEITCPEHGIFNHHILSESALLGYWKQDVLVEVTGDITIE